MQRWEKLLVFIILIIGCSIFFWKIADFRSPIVDEVDFLYSGWRIAEGSIPYKDFFIGQPPMLFFFFAGLFKLFGPNALFVRYLNATVASFLVFLIFLVGSKLQNWKVGVLSGLILVFDPLLLFFSKAIDLEIYVAFLDFIAIGYFYFRRDRIGDKGLLFVAAILTLGLYTKLHSAFTFAAIFLFLFFNERHIGKAVKLLMFYAIFSGAIFILLLSYAGPEFIWQVFLFYIMRGISQPNAIISVLVGLSPIALILGLAGIFFSKLERKSGEFLLMYYLILQMFFLSRGPFWDHQTVAVLPALTVFAGIFIYQAWREGFPLDIGRLRQVKLKAIAVVILALILLSPTLPDAFEQASSRIELALNPDQRDKFYLQETAAFVRDNTNPDDIILSSEEIGFYAQRRILFDLEIYGELQYEKLLVETHGFPTAYRFVSRSDWNWRVWHAGRSLNRIATINHLQNGFVKAIILDQRVEYWVKLNDTDIENIGGYYKAKEVPAWLEWEFGETREYVSVWLRNETYFGSYLPLTG